MGIPYYKKKLIEIKPSKEEVDAHYSSTLCWDCARACGSAGCPWADSLKPVPDWVIDKNSGRVMYCPSFIPGSCSSELSSKELDNLYSNDYRLIGTEHAFCRPQKIPSKALNTCICPVCYNEFSDRRRSCSVCSINFLYPLYSHNYNHIELRNIQKGGENNADKI